MNYPPLPPTSVSFNFPPLVSQVERFLNLDFVYSATKQGVQFDINLTYNFLSTEELKEFLSFFNQSGGTWKTFGLPVTVWRHPLPVRVELDKYLQFCAFRFKDKPVVRTRGSGIFDLEVTLISDLNLDQKWLTVPPEEPKPQFVIFCQDNAPPDAFSYWENQYKFYHQLASELEMENQLQLESDPPTKTQEYEFITVFLSDEDATLSNLLSFPSNNSQYYAVLISGGSSSYLKANLSASNQVDKDLSTLRSVREYLDQNTEFTYQFESFLLEYPNPFQESSWSKTKEISDNSIGLLESALTTNTFGTTQRIAVPSTSSNWGGNRATLKTAIVDFFTSLP